MFQVLNTDGVSFRALRFLNCQYVLISLVLIFVGQWQCWFLDFASNWLPPVSHWSPGASAGQDHCFFKVTAPQCTLCINVYWNSAKRILIIKSWLVETISCPGIVLHFKDVFQFLMCTPHHVHCRRCTGVLLHSAVCFDLKLVLLCQLIASQCHL